MNTTAIIIIVLLALAAATAFILLRQRDQVEIKDLRDKRNLDEGGMKFNQQVNPPKDAEDGEPRVMQWGGGKLDASALRTESDVEHTGGDAPMGWADQPLGSDLPISGPGGQRVRIIERHMDPDRPETGGPASEPPRIVMQWGEGPMDNAPPNAAPGSPIFSRPAEQPTNVDPGVGPDMKEVESQGDSPDSGTSQNQKPDSKADPSA